MNDMADRVTGTITPVSGCGMKKRHVLGTVSVMDVTPEGIAGVYHQYYVGLKKVRIKKIKG